MSEAPDKLFRMFPGKEGFPDLTKDPFKWVTPDRFEKNPNEQEISDLYAKARLKGGLGTPEGWEVLTGENPERQTQGAVTIIMPAYREPGIGGTIDSLLLMAKPDDVHVQLIIAADGGENVTLEAARKYEGAHGNIQVIVKPFERSGKIGVIKKAVAEMPEENDFIICDADCRFGSDAIGLVWAGMKRFPEVPVVSGLSLPVSNESLMHKLTLPRNDAGTRRVSGPLVGLRKDVVELVPNDFKWEDYFLMTWMDTYDYDYLCIQEANAFYLPPVLHSEQTRAGERMKQGLQQIDDAISISEGFIPTHSELKPTKRKIILQTIASTYKALKNIRSHKLYSSGENKPTDNSMGWEPNTTTKPTK